MVDQGVDPETAIEQCTAIVIHGDDLARKSAEEAALDDNDPEKGRFLVNYLRKEEVVFARTTPSQKL